MRRSTAGVTLMELIIAITLLSLLSVGLLFALRVGMSAYSKTQSRLMDNRRVVGAQRILDQELEGMVPVVAMCGGTARTAFFRANRRRCAWSRPSPCKARGAGRRRFWRSS